MTTKSAVVLPCFRFSEAEGKWVDVTGEESQPIPLKDFVIVQYNIWFGSYHMEKRMEGIVSELQSVGADIVCFQEVKKEILAVILAFPFIRQNYCVSDITGKTLGGYGVLQLSRFKFHSLTIHRMRTKLGRNALVSSFKLEGRNETMAVATAHLESYPIDVALRKEQMMTIFDILKDFDHRFFTADFNFAEEGEDGIFPAEYTDVWPALYPNEPGYTFSDENPVRNDMPPGKRRIDRILLHSSYWIPKTASILGDKPFTESDASLRPSDHYGVAATFGHN